jgi:hypothetical protein
MNSGLLKRLEEVAAAYGSDPERWPADERSLLEEAARVRPDLLAEAREVDQVLAHAAVPPATAEGKSRLLQIIASERQARPGNVVSLPVRPRSPAWSWAAAAALAASLAFGIYLGTLEGANVLFDPAGAASDDPVDLAGLGDVSDYLEGES